ncbi:Leo1-domain-containing protein [Ceratobasidium sp. AG-I]|nr:Leo1-domain-containing protein [Ceratobasidium sp. AG-I]
MSDTYDDDEKAKDVNMDAPADPVFDEEDAGTEGEIRDATVADLFGDEEAQEDGAETRDAEVTERQSSATPSPRGSDADGLTEAERKHRKALEYEEEEEGEMEPPTVLREAEVNIPKLPLPTSSDHKYWMMRMPNFLKLDTKPFHRDTYEGPQEDYEGEERRESAIMLDVSNTIRWRWAQGENGEMKKETNSRIVRWSDGSMSLQLGTEIFDISTNVDGAPPTTSTSASQSQTQPKPVAPKRAGGLSYLYTQHKHAGVLQCEVPITGTMTLQPTGMFSATHRQLVRAVGQRHSRTARLRLAPEPTMDPEREQRELQKTANRTARPRKPRASGGGGFDGGRRNRASGATRRREEVFGSDESGGEGGSDSDDGFDGRRKVQAAPKRGGEYVADDFVVTDEEDEDVAGSSPAGKKRRKRAEDTDAGMDSLDEADEKIEREAAKRRKQEKEAGKAANDSDAEGNQDVDMEDSAEEQEASVRKAGGKARKKRAVALDDEDEDE